MLPIFWWIIATALGSFSTPPLKKSLSLWKNIPDSFLKLFAAITGIFLFTILTYFLWFEKQILGDLTVIAMIFWVSILWIISNLMWIYVYKTTKLSELLPYENLDKLFIIIIGFFLYQSIPWQETSIITFIITIITIIIIGIFTVDPKHLKISKNIWVFIWSKLFHALMITALWYILIHYSTFSYGLVSNIMKALLLLWIGMYLKNHIRVLFKQSKSFYKHRFTAIAMWEASMLIWLLIIETSWVIIASLLWFISVVFNIASMKIMLGDTPSKKQVILAFIVITMIWLGYYFK